MVEISFNPSPSTLEKLDLIDKIQQDSEKEGFKLWHCGSWAITAMLGKFFKDMNDIDIVVESEEAKEKLVKIVEKYGFTFSANHPHGPIEYTNGKYEIEFGTSTDARNFYYHAAFSPDNFGFINGIKLYLADPKKILQSRYEMIKAGYKQLDDTQKFIIKIIENYISSKK